MWAVGGIPLNSQWAGYQASPRAISDGAGGAIVVWLDGRNGWCDPSSIEAECDIYGQRIGPNGDLLWGASGSPIVTAPGNQGLGGIAMVPDGAGGAIIAFQDNRVATAPQGGSGGTTVYVHRFNGSGNPVWPVQWDTNR